MKLRRKLFTMLLACIMLVAMAVPAFAAGSGSITIQNTVKDKTYDLYKIFDLTQSGDKVAYTIDSDWNSFFTDDGAGAAFLSSANNGGSLNQVTVDGATKYINITSSNVAEFAEAALSYAGSRTADATVTGTGNDVTEGNLDLGYYLVYPRGAADIKAGNGSICSLTSTAPSATVNIKSDYPTITKEVTDTNPEIGQTITYTIMGQVPDTTGYDTYTYEVKDILSPGLTYNTSSLNVKIAGTEVTPITVSTVNNGFDISINVKNQQTNVGKDIVITYTATVNKDAVVGSAGNPNSAELIYSNDPSDSTSKTTNPPVVVKVYTAKLVIDKVDGTAADKTADSAKLAGAKFVLTKADNGATKYYKYNTTTDTVSWADTQEDATEVTTDANGAASFNGLENGTYSLVETEAPEGYNKLTTPVSVTISYEKGSTNVGQTTQVENLSGTELPSTGGIGTTIFYILGGILVVGAGVVLVVRRRMTAEK